MRIAHVTASTHFGGPERQMLGLAAALHGDCPTLFLSFPEGGRCEAFIGRARAAGFDAQALLCDTPRLRSAVSELAGRLRRWHADVVLCHGYKSNLLGRMAARRLGVPAVAVSRGWTGESARVRVYESLDRWHLRFMDRVVAVSEGQARKVRRAGVPNGKLLVIRNSARPEAFAEPDPDYRGRLREFLPGAPDDARVVVAAGRLSPEKGYHVLVEAAAAVCAGDERARFVHFGEGPERPRLERMIEERGLSGRFVLGGFRDDLDKLLPWADVMALPSFTEGLPNVVLESSAAGVPVVATAVGGTPEVLADGETGLLVGPGDAAALAAALTRLLADAGLRRRMGEAGRKRVAEEFTFDAQAREYRRLFEALRPRAFLSAVA